MNNGNNRYKKLYRSRINRFGVLIEDLDIHRSIPCNEESCRMLQKLLKILQTTDLLPDNSSLKLSI